ncbi:MAG: hypothetical protein HOW97_08475 [Catenulispora sp.]|nr:hypothetical protein [Catenulispora sp.]
MLDGFDELGEAPEDVELPLGPVPVPVPEGVDGDGEPVLEGVVLGVPLGELAEELVPVPVPPLEDGLVLGLEDGGLCGVLGGLDGGVVGGLLGGVLGPDVGVEEPGVLGVVEGLPLGVPGFPEPLSATVCPPGSKRTCACQAVLGSAPRSTAIRIVVCAPGAMIPDTALRVIHGASGEAVHSTGPEPEFHNVTVTSPGVFERCVTLTFSCPAP